MSLFIAAISGHKSPMAEKICRFCFTTPAFTSDFSGINGLETCIACLDEWAELSHTAADPRRISWNSDRGIMHAGVHSLFAYRGQVRRHIIAAKVQGDHTAVGRLLAVWGDALTKIPDIEGISAVMPCPSSLWGRLRGRLDLAWMLAEHTSRQFGLPLVRPPRRLYWRLHKRARLERPVDNLLINLWENGPVATPQGNFHHRCLLIDDVVTTGATIKHCLEAASANFTYHFSIVTLARARHATY